MAVMDLRPRPSSSSARRFSGVILAAGLVLVVGLSRLAVLPVSVWEQDEAYLAAAAVGIDLAESRPHPPFFPLWVGIGTALHAVGCEPAGGLQLASAMLSSLMVVPLTMLWAVPLGRRLAVASALLTLSVPGVWLLSARAFSGGAATPFLVLALALWTRPTAGPAALAAGSAAAGAAVLIRPQLVAVVVAAAVVVLCRVGRRRWRAVAAPAALLVAVGFAVFVVAAGGPAEVTAAVARHAAGHFGALAAADRGLAGSGLARALVHPAILALWLGLAAIGAATVLRSDGSRLVGSAVLAAVAALSLVVFALSNPAHPRYATPIVVLSGGLVATGLRRLVGERATLAVIALAICGSAMLVLPAARELRARPSPPVAALDRADRLAAELGGVVVVDRALHAFVVLREATGDQLSPVLFDHVLELGGSSPPAPAVVVRDVDPGSGSLSAAGIEVFACDDPLLRRLGQGRFLEVTVASVGDRSPRRAVPKSREGLAPSRQEDGVVRSAAVAAGADPLAAHLEAGAAQRALEGDVGPGRPDAEHALRAEAATSRAEPTGPVEPLVAADGQGGRAVVDVEQHAVKAVGRTLHDRAHIALDEGDARVVEGRPGEAGEVLAVPADDDREQLGDGHRRAAG
jgi:hypothetical protein